MPDPTALDDAIARAARAEQQAAEYGLALDVLTRLVGVTSEEAVADVVLEFAQTMFGAGRVRITILDRHSHPTRCWERGPSGILSETPVPGEDGGAWAASDRELGHGGLRVPVGLDRRPLARLEMADLEVPEASERYAPTVWVIARVAAMALATVRELRGLVPICAGCKRVRDGAGTWHRFEEWFTANSEAQLSHGLCPACLAAAEREAGLEPDDQPRGPLGSAPGGREE